MTDESFPPPLNRAQRRSAARRAAAAGSAVVLASAAGAVMTFTGSVAGALPTDVTNCYDSGPGSLSDAIDEANSNPDPTTITITATCTTSSPVAMTAQMLIQEETTIVGPGAANFVLDGGGVTSLLYVNTSGDVTISGITVQNGSGADGGGVQVAQTGNLTVSGVVFTGNSASQDGGALYLNGSGTVTIVDSLFTGNHADENGGALYIINNTGPVVISNSTFADNSADGDGGAITIYEHPGAVSVYNSTITGNTAGNRGGAIFSHGLYGDGTLLFNTIADNEGGDDSGLNVQYADDNTWTLGGNIFTGPGSAVVVDPIQAIVTYDNDFHGSVSGFTPAASDLDVDPQLEELADNGGPTPTRALAATSPVIDRGPASWTAFTGDAFDQRGTPHARVVDGRADMGAFEFAATGPGPEPTPDPRFTG